CLYDHARLDAELPGHGGVDAHRDPVCRRGGRAEQRIAAVEQRTDVAVTETGEQIAQVGHGDALGLADIDAAKQRDVACHQPAAGLAQSKLPVKPAACTDCMTSM